MKRKREQPLPPWTRFHESLYMEEQLRVWRGLPTGPPHQTYRNSRYQVDVRFYDNDVFGRVAEASIKSHWKDARHDWRDFQRIKNELFGPEREAIEIYPAESRLVDTANQYWLYVFERYVVPLGFRERLVSEGNTGNGAVQRPFELGARPADCMSAQQVDRMIAEARDNNRRDSDQDVQK